MYGPGFQLTQGRGGEDGFYSSAKARRGSQSHRSDQLRRARSDVTASQSLYSKEKSVASTNRELENRFRFDAITKPVGSPAGEPVVSPRSNLERFLESITPSVPVQHLSKTAMKGLGTCDSECRPYFVLGDVWESFTEWSAYGAGVPLVMNGRDRVVQYYVPYLSAIQIYADPLSRKPTLKSRRPDIDSDSDYRDSSSDGSSDSELERGYNYSEEQISARINRMSLRDHQNLVQEGFSSDDGESVNSEGRLIFEYLERGTPYDREPLTDKILDLATQFPGLRTLRSCDLSSSSWLSVAWYPIYRIPTGPTLKDLDACFLTYHSLYTAVGGSKDVQAPVSVRPREVDGVLKMALPVFGLASYKFKGSLWTPNGGSDRQLANFLLQAAGDWLRERQVDHPDFLFFYHR